MRFEKILGGIWTGTSARAEPDDACQKDTEEDSCQDADADYEGGGHGELVLILSGVGRGRIAREDTMML